ncbi:MAG: hypothetical protein Q8R37_06055 [Nanoarchaeota archaeon]|nr:hypothetical protein [Nanoarchaeota archaeon]
MTSDVKQIMEMLSTIKSELDYIKDHMIDVDTILTSEDRKALVKAEEEFKKRKTISHEELKKELGL